MDYADFERRLRGEMQSNSAASSNPEQSTSQPTSRDVDMAGHNVDDDMPDLQSISDSDSDRDANEVEMQAVSDQPPIPEVDPSPPQSRTNRRTRVEDDEDEERDRRHPSERVNTPLPGAESTRNLPRRPNLASFFDLFGAPPPAAPTANSAAPGNNNDNSNSNNASNADNAAPGSAPQFMTGGIAISIDIGPEVFNGDANAEGGAMPGLTADALRELLGIEPDVEDPERAERLIKGLEEVPIGLVRRLERVGGATGVNGEDLGAGDSGCAVCWERLLVTQDSVENAEKKELPQIVALPCAHVFHADCLRPWFSRPKHTTCPTCRFNIDPENLTYVPYSQRNRTQEQREQAAGPSSHPTPPAASTPDASIPPTLQTSAGSPASSSSTISETDEARGRIGPPPAPNVAPGNPPQRRTSSEPPTTRRPHTGLAPQVVQSFPVPGGHVVVVNHPIGIITDAQGRPTGVTGQQRQEVAHSPAAASESQPVPAAAHAQNPPGPTRPLNATPRMTMPGGGQLPPGVVAFDIRLPFPIPLFPSAPSQPVPQSQPAATQGEPPSQPIRPPGTGFAGLNFGNPQAGTQIDPSDLMRRLFSGIPMPGAPPQAAPTTAAPAAAPAPESQPESQLVAEPASAPSSRQASPGAEGQNDEQQQPNMNTIEDLFRNYLNNPAAMFRLLMSAAMAGAVPMGAMPGARGHPRRNPNAPKKEWNPPPAPGPTLRQRVERREREAGLRCYDVSCGVGPSDEDPFIALSDTLTKQCSIRSKEDDNAQVCPHTFHSSCLVSAERVALRGADATVIDGNVEVSCPVCRGSGVISKVDWDAGVHGLE